MMNFLKKNKYHIHADVPPHEVQEIYENSLTSTSNHEELLPKIMYPLDCISAFRNDKIIFGDQILSFNIAEGGRFTPDTENLPDETIAATLSLFCWIC